MMRKKAVTAAVSESLPTSPKKRTTRAASHSLLVAGCLCGGGMVCLVYAMVHFMSRTTNSSSRTRPAVTSPYASLTTVEAVRQAFYDRYGGEAAAMELYHRGMQQYGSVTATAHRILRLTNTDSSPTRPLELAFGGYSVTVGRGNFHVQSYPMVLQEILSPVLHHAWSTPLQVRNAAIGGIPSFPYGFCLPHFLGRTADLVSWDYSMNEPHSDASILEAYVRHASVLTATTSPRKPPPLVLVLDSNPQRCRLLQTYVEQGYLTDALCVGLAKDIIPDYANFLKASATPSHQDDLPTGFQHWHDFGAPPACPGRGNWHPKYQEHALVAWLIAIYFCDAMDEAKRLQAQPNWRSLLTLPTTPVSFGPPVETKPVRRGDNAPNVTRLLYGHVDTKADATVYRVHPVACRTSFLPATEPQRDLPSLIVSGWNSDTTAASILTPRTLQHYQAGWVLDVSQVERETKLKVESCGGLGYIDMKIALYGIPQSGSLRLWLPVEDTVHAHDHDHSIHDMLDAHHWVSELVLCEANEKRGKGACQLTTDLTFHVGGVVVEPLSVSWIHGAGEYLKRPTCIHVGLPPGAQMTRFELVTDAQGVAMDDTVRARLQQRSKSMGLVVDVSVTNPKVTRDKGACCLSHVVWQHA